MATPKELANKARTTLAQALGALQSPGVPDDLVTIAEPIARTMGMLHRIEKAGSATEEACAEALDTTRTVLDSLQRFSGSHAAVDSAMEAVAGSLSKLFALARSVRPSSPPAEPIQQAPVAAPQPAHESNPAFQAPQPAPQQAYQAPQPAPQQAYQAPQPAPQQAYQAPQPAPQQAYQAPQPAPQQAYQAPQPAPQQAYQAPQQAYQAPQPAPAAAPAANSPFAGSPFDKPLSELNATMPLESAQQAADLVGPAATEDSILVELGAHSDSNFYKGLSGNDVIDHGGIFVATYKIPKMGTAVSLRIHLPGDLEFLADAVVQWTRETRSGESEPGFGARITRVSDEGRQLVYRYVRNREPIFYDDM